jgi:tetratricopeptide (TPR) repeat protein
MGIVGFCWERQRQDQELQDAVIVLGECDGFLKSWGLSVASEMIALYEKVVEPRLEELSPTDRSVALYGVALAYCEVGRYGESLDCAFRIECRGFSFSLGRVFVDTVARHQEWSVLRMFGERSAGTQKLYLLAWADVEEGRGEKAVAPLERVLAADPRTMDYDALWLLARAHKQMGDRVKAAACTAKYLAEVRAIFSNWPAIPCPDAYKHSVLGRALARSALVLADIDPSAARKAAEESLEHLKDIDVWYQQRGFAIQDPQNPGSFTCVWAGDAQDLRVYVRQMRDLLSRAK